MAAVSTVWNDPRHADWINQNGPLLGWGSQRAWREFKAEFGIECSLSAFSGFANRLRNGGYIIPRSSQRIITDEVLRITAKGALITADHQIPYHDAEWMEFAFEMGKGFGCDTHILNGDVFDLAVYSRFDAQLSDKHSTLEDELQVVEQIIEHSSRLFKETVMLYGNHEWRLIRRIMQAQLSAERFARLFATDALTMTELSFVIVNDRVRVTHPRAYSRIAARVGTALASKHHQDIVAAHDHQVGYARDISGKFTVVHSGCMADPRRMDYVQTADSTAPTMSQGFVVLTPGGQLILFDRSNVDREFWRHALKRGRAAA